MPRAKAVAADIACVIVFVAIGRRQHGEESALRGIVQTAGPFLIALGVAWLAVGRRPVSGAELRSGLPIWAGTVVVGMVLRRTLFDSGTASAFVIVATVFLAATMLGWRALATVAVRRRTAGA